MCYQQIQVLIYLQNPKFFLFRQQFFLTLFVFPVFWGFFANLLFSPNSNPGNFGSIHVAFSEVITQFKKEHSVGVILISLALCNQS